METNPIPLPVPVSFVLLGTARRAGIALVAAAVETGVWLLRTLRHARGRTSALLPAS